MEPDLSDDNSPTEKTQVRYNGIYDAFMKWKRKMGFQSFDEDVLLAYFEDASKTYKSSTLKSMYSILRRMFIIYDNIDITPYNRLLDLLKEHHARYVRTKGKVFTSEEIDRFMADAPDDEYLAMKAIMVFGVTGGCRCKELQNIKADHVKDCGTEIIVTAPRNRRTLPEMFLISGEFAKIVRKYMRLRPAKSMTDKFFLQYSQGECENAVIGRNKFANIPKEIAKFLQLDDYKLYSGHSFQTSNIQKSHRRWKEAKVVEAKLQHYQNVVTPSDSFRRPATASKSDTSKRLAGSASSILNVENLIVKPEFGETMVPVTSENLLCPLWTSNQHQTETSCEPFVPMLPVTMSLMKRKSKYYLGLQPTHLLHLLQVVSDRKLISDVKFMLTLRKLRLNEEFEVLGDAFDMDRTMAEKWYNESKHDILDLVDGLDTGDSTPMTEQTIKVEKFESPYVPDPIAFESDDDSTAEMRADDHDDIETTLPELSSDDDRGFLSHELKRRTAECTVCHKWFVPRLLNSHMDSVHFNLGNLNRTYCGLCWKEFATEKLLKTHQKGAHGGGCCCCDICGKIFASKRYIMAHILQKHAQVKTHLCDTCGEGFSVPYLLLDHNKRKHNEPGHACHLCDMKFVQALKLKDHIVARHTTERPYVCEVKGCGKSFSWPSSFKSHKRVHAANDKFECPICFKGFSFKRNLRNHLKTMHNEVVDNQYLTIKSV